MQSRLVAFALGISSAMGCGDTAPPSAVPPAAEAATVGPCSAEQPDGVCPDDHYCVGGSCAEIAECTRDAAEWNGSIARAAALVFDSPVEARICERDEDWYRVDVP